MRNVQSSVALLHQNLGKQHDLVFPLLPVLLRLMAPGDILANTALPSSHEHRVSFCNPGSFSTPQWGFSSLQGFMSLPLAHLFCPKREDLTQSCEARNCSKAAWAWEGGCFTATLQRIWIDFPFPLWAPIRFPWTSVNAGGVGNAGTLCPSALCLCKLILLVLITLFQTDLLTDIYFWPALLFIQRSQRSVLRHISTVKTYHDQLEA